jgi:hypothetical protein
MDEDPPAELLDVFGAKYFKTADPDPAIIGMSVSLDGEAVTLTDDYFYLPNVADATVTVELTSGEIVHSLSVIVQPITWPNVLLGNNAFFSSTNLASSWVKKRKNDSGDLLQTTMAAHNSRLFCSREGITYIAREVSTPGGTAYVYIISAAGDRSTLYAQSDYNYKPRIYFDKKLQELYVGWCYQVVGGSSQKINAHDKYGTLLRIIDNPHKFFRLAVYNGMIFQAVSSPMLKSYTIYGPGWSRVVTSSDDYMQVFYFEVCENGIYFLYGEFLPHYSAVKLEVLSLEDGTTKWSKDYTSLGAFNSGRIEINDYGFAAVFLGVNSGTDYQFVYNPGGLQLYTKSAAGLYAFIGIDNARNLYESM